MVAAVAEPEVYTGRVPTSYAERMRERRRLDAVASDLIASSRRVEVPDGIFTVVDARFLGELLDVCHATGERIFVVVDDDHLARVAQVAGLAPTALRQAEPPARIDPADIRALRAWKGWSQQAMADAFGVSGASISMWERGTTEPVAERRVRIADLIAEMKAAQAAEGATA